MNRFFQKAFGRLIKLRVEGSINQKMIERIHDGLKVAAYLPVSHLAVTINSKGGSFTQTNHIVDMINNFCSFKKIEYDCFAEDKCLGSANIILTSGSQCYINKMTMLGGFGKSFMTLSFQKLAKEYGIKREYVMSCKNEKKLSVFEEVTPEMQEFTFKQLSHLQKLIRSKVIKNRNNKIKQMDIEQLFSDKPTVKTADAIKFGYVDGIMNFQDFYDEKFAKKKLFVVNKRHPYDSVNYQVKFPTFESLRKLSL